MKHLLLAVALLLPAAPAQAVEWRGHCGVTKASVASCTFTKGDAALDGETGMSITYVLPSGDTFQKFTPDSVRGSICNSVGLMRKNKGAWFKVHTSCENGFIINSLPSGNSMLIEVYETD